MIAALFQDSGAAAIAAGADRHETAGTGCVSFTYWMTAGTAVSTTFKVRGGGRDAGTTTFNGVSGTRDLGGVFSSSITITEYKV